MIGTVARHLAGMAAAWLVFLVEGVVVYLGLLGYALLTGAAPGGPPAGALLILLAGAVGVALVPLLFLPAGIAGEAAAKGGRLAGKLSVAFGVAAPLAAVYVAIVAVATDVTAADLLLACLVGAAAVLGPTAVAVGITHTVWRSRRARVSG